MSETCTVCGTVVKKPFKHISLSSVSEFGWKDYNKKAEKIKHKDRPGTIITYYCSHSSMVNKECITDEEE
jgi:hypothetical protein